MVIDPLYFILMIPAFLLALWAQARVKSSYSKWARAGTRRGASGADVAARILAEHGIDDVRIEEVPGFLSDHYDPRRKTLRLSPENFHGRSIAALGVAAHEVGHAIQHAQGYFPLQVRSLMVPAVSIGSNLSTWVLSLGVILYFVGAFSTGTFVWLLWGALFGLAGATVFSVVTLPVEFDASARALRTLEGAGYLAPDEMDGAREVLRAAAWTYVAGAVSAIITLIWFLLRYGHLLGLGRSRDD